MVVGAVPAAGRGRMTRREKIIWIAGLVAVVVLAVWVLPRVASYAEIAHALRLLSPSELALLLALGLAGIAANGWTAMLALPGLTWWQGTLSTLCGNFLIALFPTGADLAVRYAMYRSWGFTADQVTTAIALAGLARYLVLLLLPLAGIAAVLVTGHGDRNTPLLFALGCVVVALLVVVPWLLLHREDLAHRFAGRLESTSARLAGLFRRRPPHGVAERIVRARHNIILGLRRHAAAVVFAQVLSTAASYLVLLAALRAVGLGADLLSWAEILYAYAIGTIAAMVPVTPGNIGVTELVLLGVLGLEAADLNAAIIAATLLFRVFTWLLPVPLGVASFLWWRASALKRDEAAQRDERAQRDEAAQGDEAARSDDLNDE
jgi:uncharacterized membrane protein YbhN (UPF0104 family)